MKYSTLLENIISEMSSLSRVKQSIDKHDCGILTAFRGNLTRRENLQRNIELVQTLRGEGFGVTAVLGAYVEDIAGIDPREVTENSFLVVDIKDTGNLKERLKELGAQYDQDSILFIHGGTGTLIGTSDRESAYPPRDEEDEQGDFLALGDRTLKTNEFRSRVRNRPFSFTQNR